MEKPQVVYKKEPEYHNISYLKYFVVWGALLCLTAFTVLSSKLNFGEWSTIICLTIATIKASLVIAIFMHMYYEKPVFKYILIAAVTILIIFISLTLVDYSFR